MKADARPDRDDGAEREELRALLRHWRAPEPPAAVEDRLRLELRNRRPRRRLGVWLSLAACLGLLAAWPLVAPDRGGAPSAAPLPAAGPKPAESPSPRIEPAESSPGRLAAGGTRAGRPAPRPRAEEPAVVVEPGQAELLAEFGRRAWEAPQAPSEVPVQGMATSQTPAYRAEWEDVAGEWPVVQVVVPTSGR